MLRVFPDRGGDPDRAGKKDPLDCVVWRGRATGRAVVGQPVGARAGRAGTSSAPPWRSSTSAAPSTSRAAAATWSSRTTRCAPARPRWPSPGTPFAQVYAHAGMVGYDGEKMSKSPRQPGLRLGAAQQRRRPDGDPAGAAAPPLPQRLGVGRPGALGRRRRPRRLAQGTLAGCRRPGGTRRPGGARRDGQRPRRTRPPSPPSTPGWRPRSAPTAWPTPPTRTPR